MLPQRRREWDMRAKKQCLTGAVIDAILIAVNHGDKWMLLVEYAE